MMVAVRMSGKIHRCLPRGVGYLAGSGQGLLKLNISPILSVNAVQQLSIPAMLPRTSISTYRTKLLQGLLQGLLREITDRSSALPQ